MGHILTRQAEEAEKQIREDQAKQGRAHRNRTVLVAISRNTSTCRINHLQNRGGTVEGQDYSGHAFDQMRYRGLVPSVVENAIRTGQKLPGKFPGTAVYFDATNSVKVVVNQDGKVVTVE
jgi:hypothetical protein